MSTPETLNPSVVEAASADPSFARVLPEHECYELLAVATVGRIGFTAPTGLTTILPVDYRLGPGPRLFMLTASRGIFAQLAETNASVAFEVDYAASDFQIAWSVLMNGTLSLLDGEDRAVYDGLRRPPIPWPGEGRSLPVKFRPQKTTGRAIHRH